jgi:hypothetical protein
MLHLPEAARAWGTSAFAAALKAELADRGSELPLQQAASLTSSVTDDRIEALLLDAAENGGRIHARVGIFFSGIVAGCSCADDPTPVEPVQEYCELRLSIDPTTGATAVDLQD